MNINILEIRFAEAELSNPWAKGYSAFYAGIARTQNPYRYSNCFNEFCKWYAGWEAAANVARYER